MTATTLAEMTAVAPSTAECFLCDVVRPCVIDAVIDGETVPAICLPCQIALAGGPLRVALNSVLAVEVAPEPETAPTAAAETIRRGDSFRTATGGLRRASGAARIEKGSVRVCYLTSMGQVEARFEIGQEVEVSRAV